VLTLANGVYEDGSFEALPVLAADAAAQGFPFSLAAEMIWIPPSRAVAEPEG
jgi:hypothetical protein